MNYELNNIRKDNDAFSGKFTQHSPIVEIFSAMVNGSDLNRFGAAADKAVKYIKELGVKAENGDSAAISELNTLRRFVIETPILEEIRLLGIFGSYQNVGWDETVEREVYTHVGERSRAQAEGGDVVFPAISRETYPVPMFTVSGGYEVDYRRVAAGDMTKENEGMALVRTDILNNAKAEIVKRVYNAIKAATGVKYWSEAANISKPAIDNVLINVRRNGRPTIIGDYATISQLTPYAGYVGSISSNTITGISERVMNEIQQNGVLSMYNGAVVAEMPNPYNYYKLKADGSNFETMLPAGLMFVIPTGVNSPIATYSQGGLTSLTANDVKSGKIVTRFDLRVGCDVAKGQEHKIGVILDTNLSVL